MLKNKGSNKKAIKIPQNYKTIIDSIENSDIGFFRSTIEGKILFCNQAFISIFGYKSLESIRKISTEELYFNKSDRTKALAEITKKGYIKGKELVFRKKNGEKIYVLVYSKAIFDKNKKIKYIDGFIEDITALKNKEIDILEAKRKLEILNKINASLSGVLDINELLEKCMSIVLSNLPEKIGAVLYLVEDDWLVPESFYAFNKDDFFFPVKIGSSEEFGNISSEVFYRKKEVVAKNTNNKKFLLKYPKFKNVKPHSFAIFPILFNDSCIGVLNLFTDTVNYFDNEKVKFLKLIVKQLGIYIHNALEYKKTNEKIKEIKDKYNEIKSSYDISLRLSSYLEFDKVVNECFSILKENKFTSARIYLTSEESENLNLIAFYGDDNNISQYNELKKGELFSGLAYLKKENVIVNSSHSEFALKIAPSLKEMKEHSFASLPIIFGNKCIGVLTISSSRVNAFNNKGLLICESIAKQLALVLNNVLLHSTALQKSNNLEQLYNTIRRLTRHFDINDVFNEAFEIFKEMGFVSCKIYRLNEKENILELISFYSGRTGNILEKIKVGEYFSGKAARELTPVIINDTYSEEALKVDPNLKLAERHSFASFPLEYEGKCLGILGVVFPNINKFTTEVINLCVNICKHIALLWNNYQIHEQTQSKFDRISLLYETTKKLSSYVSVNDIITECFNFFRELGFTDSRVFLLENGKLNLFTFYSDSNIINEIPKSISEGNLISQSSLQKNEPIIINDTHDKIMIEVYPELLNYRKFSFSAFPIEYGNKKLGVLNLSSDEVGKFDESNLFIIKRLVQHLGILLNNSRLYDELLKKNKELKVLNELSAELNKKMDLFESGEIITNKLSEFFDLDGFYIDLYNRDNNTLSNVINVDIIDGKKTFYKGEQNRQVTNPFIRNIINTKEPYLLLRESENDKIFSLNTFGDKSRRSLSLMYVPIYSEEEVFGIICVHSYKKNAFNEDNLNLLSSIANYISISIKNILLYNTLRDSENRYKTLIENAPEAIYSIDKNGLFIAVNKKTCEFLNQEESVLINKSVVSFVDINLRNSFIESFKIAKETQTPVTFDIKTLTDKYYQTTLMPIYEEVTNQMYFIGITRDITLQKKSEEDKLKVQQQISESKRHEFIVNITRNIAHVFNNVLVNVLSRSSFAKTIVDKNSAVYSHLEKIEASSKRVGELVKQLLTFAQSGNYLMDKADLNKIVQFFFFSNKPKIRENINFNLFLSDQNPQVICNRDQILVVFDKLFTNCIEAISEKGNITIKTELVNIEKPLVYSNQKLEVGVYGVISFIDDGCGIREDVKNRFFEPFNTTKEYGRGLGLPSVYGIIISHNGFINIQSEINKGTTVEVYLPIAK